MASALRLTSNGSFGGLVVRHACKLFHQPKGEYFLADVSRRKWFSTRVKKSNWLSKAESGVFNAVGQSVSDLQFNTEALRDLTSGDALKALSRFSTRTTVAMVDGDMAVPYATAAILTMHGLAKNVANCFSTLRKWPLDDDFGILRVWGDFPLAHDNPSLTPLLVASPWDHLEPNKYKSLARDRSGGKMKSRRLFFRAIFYKTCEH